MEAVHTALRLAATGRGARLLQVPRLRTLSLHRSIVSSSMSSWTRLRSADGKHGYAVFSDTIRKPDLDDRDYRLIELDNGLRAVLVHDAGAEKAAACLTVQVGAMFDPVSLASSLQGNNLLIALAARRAGNRPLL